MYLDISKISVDSRQRVKKGGEMEDISLKTYFMRIPS